MKVPIAQALTLKVGFLSSLNTVFYGDTTGTVGGRRPSPRVAIKNHCTRWEPRPGCQEGPKREMEQQVHGFSSFCQVKELLKEWNGGSSRCGSVVTNPSSIHEDWGSIPGLAQWVKDLALPCRLQTRLRSCVAVAVV